MPEAVTSLAFSPSGEFLATTHVDNLGIFLWTNRSLFGTDTLKPIHEGRPSLAKKPSCLSLPHIVLFGFATLKPGDKPEMLRLPVVADERPTTSADDDDVDGLNGQAEEDKAAAGHQAETLDNIKSAEQLDADLITLSTLPKSRWVNLSKLDVIRRRNKPTEPPKAPSLAPFFLGTVPGLVSTFKPTEDPLAQLGEDGSSSRILNFGKLGTLSAFQHQLVQCGKNHDCTSADC